MVALPTVNILTVYTNYQYTAAYYGLIPKIFAKSAAGL